MNRHIARSIRLAVLLAALMVPAALHAQVAANTCNPGWASFGALGISSFTCDCTLTRKDDVSTWSFRGEPVISAITPGGTASGKLRRGDVIVAINGLLITTRAAGEKVANLELGESVVLTIRRNGRVQEVAIMAEDDCSDVAVPALAATPPASPPAMTPSTGRPPRQPVPLATTTPPSGRPPRQPGPPVAVAGPRTPMVPPVPETPPSAWFGFGISCHDCRVGPSREGRIWDFSEYPTIYSVDPESPADQAGLRRGDVLMKIDGFDLLAEEGAKRFGNIEPGQTVTWSFRRGGTTRTVKVTAIEPPGRLANLDELRSTIDRMQAERESELNVETARLRSDLLRAERETALSGRRDLSATRALVDSLRQSRSVRMEHETQALQEALAGLDRVRPAAPTVAGSDEQHLRFAGMVGNTNVEVRGLSSVDVSYDNETGELLIKTMDSTIRVKAPTR